MNIVVSFKRIWGKDLFYPVSDDAIFLVQLMGTRTILLEQLKLCIQRGWKVSIMQNPLNIESFLMQDVENSKT